MTSSKWRWLLSMLTACCVLSANAGEGEGSLRMFEAVEPHMGTLFRIKLYAANEEEAKRAFGAAFARVAALDRTLSDYQPESELSRLPAVAAGQATAVSDDLFRVLAVAQQLAEETDGAFDVTIGPLSHLWRAARRSGIVPQQAAIESARARCGYRKLHLDSVKHTALFDQAGMELDAGALGKGDAADQALAAIGQCGVRSALVAASGDLAFSDAPPGETGWKVGIDSFDRAGVPFTRVLELAHGAVSTAGAAEQHLDANGRRFSHIVDPRTGKALTEEIAVSVVARSGIEADALDTAVSVLGIDAGLPLIEKRKDVAALIALTRDGKTQVIPSSAFDRLPAATAAP